MPSALEAIHEYYKVFSTLDLNAILSFYHQPSTFIGPPGVSTAPDRAALAALLGPMVEGLRAKGYGRSEFVDAQVTTLSDRAALVRGVAVRYAAGGPEMERIPIGYLMHRGAAGWKIAVLVVGP